jgi:predicted nucleic acid-binding protein
VIIVDTNVISELMRGEPHPAVLAWVASQPRGLLYTTHINQAEILYGIGGLPEGPHGSSPWAEGPRRTALAAAATAMFAEDFAGRILPFEAKAAARYPEIVLARRQAGNPIEKFDALIAATALAAGASIATRDTGGFADCGLTVIDPWTAP